MLLLVVFRALELPKRFLRVRRRALVADGEVYDDIAAWEMELDIASFFAAASRSDGDRDARLTSDLYKDLMDGFVACRKIVGFFALAARSVFLNFFRFSVETADTVHQSLLGIRDVTDSLLKRALETSLVLTNNLGRREPARGVPTSTKPEV